MKARWVLIVTLIGATGLPGCEFGRRYVNKPWGMGTIIPALVCAGGGGGLGWYVQDIRPGTSTGTVIDQNTGETRTVRVEDDPEHWKGVVIGAAAGAVLCGLAGHYFLDPEPSTPTPPPPPPPPSPTPMPTLPPPVVKRIVLRGVNFDFDKSDIRSDSRPVLDEAADILHANPNVRIAVEGHTDAVGTDQYNEKLSMRRAEAVYRYLINQGVPPERMEAIGYGESRPVADNETASGRAQNRRVELRVVNQSRASGP